MSVVVTVVLEVSVVIPPPSEAERPVSMSTVCVMASVPVGSGWGAAGAIVAVASPDVAVSRLHAAKVSESTAAASNIR